MGKFVKSAMCQALHAEVLTLESSSSRGFAGLHLIGNVSEVCRNGLERAKTALESIGFALPNRKIVINIAPAELKKDGSHLDLAMALSLLMECKTEPPAIDLRRWLFIGELSLSGEVRPVKSIVTYLSTALQGGYDGIVMSKESLSDLHYIWQRMSNGPRKIRLIGLSHLESVSRFVWQGKAEESHNELLSKDSAYSKLEGFQLKPNFDDMVLSQELIKLAVTVCAGNHSLFLTGSPGAGKSMFAARLTSIMPDLEEEEHWQSLAIHSSHQLRADPHLIVGRPPFRSPHHQASAAAVLGTAKSPGELPLAHGGILFLDEFPEFRRDIIEGLREPLELSEVRIARAGGKTKWNAKVTLIAAANNCPCGWLGSQKKLCNCPTSKIQAYKRKISGPILDRIDLHFNMPEARQVEKAIFGHAADLQGQTLHLAEKVKKVRAFGASRNRKFNKRLNHELNATDLMPASGLDERQFLALIEPYTKVATSKRSLIRSIRVARTIADIEDCHQLKKHHLQQAWLWQKESAAKMRGDEAYGIV